MSVPNDTTNTVIAAVLAMHNPQTDNTQRQQALKVSSELLVFVRLSPWSVLSHALVRTVCRGFQERPVVRLSFLESPQVLRAKCKF